MIDRKTWLRGLRSRLGLNRLEAREVPAVVSFQQGVGGYASAVEYVVRDNGTAATNGATSQNYFLDGALPAADETHDLLRFDNIVGAGAGQIPAGAVINSATLTYTTSSVGSAQTAGPYEVTALTVPFDGTSKFASLALTPGPRTPGVTTRSTGIFESTPGAYALAATVVANASVTEIVQGWVSGTLANNGFNSRPLNTTDGWSVQTIGNTNVNFRPKLTVDYTLPVGTVTTSRFQQGVNNYADTVSIWLRENNTTTDGATLNQSFLDGHDTAGSPDDELLVRFNNLFGSGPGQVPANAVVNRAFFVLTTGNTSGNARSTGGYGVSQLLVDWDTSSKFVDNFGGDGPTTAQGEVGSVLSARTGLVDDARTAFDVSAAVQNWQLGQPNYGLNVRSTGTADGWQINFPGATDATARPELVVLWSPYVPPTVPQGSLDVTVGELFFNAGAGANNASVAVNAGVYTVSDNQPITLTDNAKAAGWTGSGGTTVTGPSDKVASLKIDLAEGTDAFTLTSVEDPIVVLGGKTAGDLATVPGSFATTGGVSLTGFDTIAFAANATLQASTLEFAATAALGSAAAPLQTKANALTLTSNGGISITEADGASFTVTAGGDIQLKSTAGTLTVAGTVTTSGKVSLVSNDAIVLNAPVTGTAGVTIAANADGIGTDGFTQGVNGSVSSGVIAAQSITVEVNTATGGTGDFVQSAGLTAFAGATVTIQANGGKIASTTSTINVNAPIVELKTTAGIGSSTQRFILSTGSFSIASGSNGVYVGDVSASNTTKLSAFAVAGGDVDLLTLDASGNNLNIAVPVTTPSGNITLRADDNLLINAPIGGGTFAGTVTLWANIDSGNGQYIQVAAGAPIATTNKSATAVVLRAFPATNATEIGGILLGDSIGAGDGGTITLDAAANGSGGPNSASRAGGLVLLPGAVNVVVSAGPLGTVILHAKDNQIGQDTAPIVVTAGTVVATTNSTISTTNPSQGDGDIFVVSTAAAKFTGVTTTADTHIGDIVFATQAGTLTIGGDTAVDSGNLILTAGGTGDIVLAANLGYLGTGGTIILGTTGSVTQTAGAIQTTGTIDLNVAKTTTIASTGNVAGTLNVNLGGSLIVNGDFNAASQVAISDGGALSGSGSVGGVTFAGAGKLSPGTSPGKLSTGNVTLTATTQVVVELNGAVAGTGYDQLKSTGTVALSGATLVPSATTKFSAGEVLEIVSATAVTGVFGNYADGTTVSVGGTDFVINYKADRVTLTAPTAPVVAAKIGSVVVNDGGAARSNVTSLTVTFDSLVTFTGGAANAFAVERLSPAAGPFAGATGAVGLTATDKSTVANTVIVLTFNGSLTEATALSLIDGNYKLSVLAAGVNNFDGDANGTVGGDYASPAPGAAGDIFRLYGDAEGNRAVDISDFNAFRIVFNTSPGASPVSAFDFDGTGTVDIADFNAFRLRFNSTLPLA